MSVARQIGRGPACSNFSDFERCAECDHAAALFPRARTDIDYPIAAGDDAHIVHDNYDRIAGLDEPIELVNKSLDIERVQSGCRLIQHVKRVTALRPLYLRRQLDALRLSPGKLGCGLAEANVA